MVEARAELHLLPSMTIEASPELSLLTFAGSPPKAKTRVLKGPVATKRTLRKRAAAAPAAGVATGTSQPEIVHLSALLEKFGERADTDRISFRELFEAFGTSSFGISLAVAAIPEAIPLPIPGATEVVVIPSVLISSQMIRGHDRLTLPEWLLKKSVSAKLFKRLTRVVLPWLRKLEKVSKPRGKWVNSKLARRLIGVLVMILSLIIALPIPGTNFAPAIAIFILGVGMIEHDQRVVLAGILLGLLSIAVIGGGLVAISAALLTA